jgi:serine phosphatase RsbU (regulator of sigma subunit)
LPSNPAAPGHALGAVALAAGELSGREMTQAGDIPAMLDSHTAAGPVDEVTEGAVTSFRPKSISVDVGFFNWDIATGEVVCDPVTFRMHGMPELQSASMDQFLARVPASDLPQVRAAMERMMAACGDYQIDYRVIGPDGSLRSMEARGRVVPGPDELPARMMGVVTDTTDARAERDAEQQRLRGLADRASRTRDFTAALASAVTVEAIVEAAGDGLRAYGADCLIVVAPRDGQLTVVAATGLDAAAVQVLSGVNSTDPTPISDAIRWRAPVYLGSPGTLAADYAHLATAAVGLTQRSWVALPVFDSAGGVGACLLGFAAPREFPAEEKALLFAAAGLLAQSLERARMHETHRAVASVLQRGMLPRGELVTPGLTIANRYQAAISGIEIGGDFYDAVPLAGGRTALVIGDVEGHNLLAASLMGRLRTAVHAYAREGIGAADVMARANRWLADLNADPEMAMFATCCLVAVDPATGQLVICRAGHPPPVLVPPGEAPRVLDCDPGLPLGVDREACFAISELVVAPGSLLVLTTDGLLETDAGDDFNLAPLLEHLGHGAAGDDLEELADSLLSAPPRRNRHGDDVALLLARVN